MVFIKWDLQTLIYRFFLHFVALYLLKYHIFMAWTVSFVENKRNQDTITWIISCYIWDQPLLSYKEFSSSCATSNPLKLWILFILGQSSLFKWYLYCSVSLQNFMPIPAISECCLLKPKAKTSQWDFEELLTLQRANYPWDRVKDADWNNPRSPKDCGVWASEFTEYLGGEVTLHISDTALHCRIQRFLPTLPGPQLTIIKFYHLLLVQ